MITGRIQLHVIRRGLELFLDKGFPTPQAGIVEASLEMGIEEDDARKIYHAVLRLLSFLGEKHDKPNI